MDGKYRDEIRKRTIRSAPQVGKHHGEGPSDGAQRNARVAAMVADRKADSKADKEQKIADRTAAAEKRRKETLAMAKEENLDEVRLLKPTKTFDRTELNTALKKHNEDMKRLRAEISAAKKAKAKAKAKPVAEEESVEEETGTEARTKIKNVARPGDPPPTSEKSTLAKTGEIKVKKVDEEIADSLSRKYGLTDSLIEAAKAIVAKKTQVDMEPKTDDKIDDDDDDVKKESKHTTPKSDKEKKLASLAHPKDKITHKDVLVGRGVLAKESMDDDDDEEEREASKATVADFRKKMAEKPKGSAYDIYNRKKLAKEEEQIDELKKSTLASYVSKASDDATKHSYLAGKSSDVDKAAKASQRIRGIATAAKKLAKEDYDGPGEPIVKKKSSNPAAAGAAAAKADDAERKKLQAAGKKLPSSLTGVKEDVEEVDEAHDIAHFVSKNGNNTYHFRVSNKGYSLSNQHGISEHPSAVIDTKFQGYHKAEEHAHDVMNAFKHGGKDAALKHLNSVTYGHKKFEHASVKEEAEQVDEVLSKKASAGEWIKDFQKSDNQKFAGKSPEKRKQMALAAYYAKRRNEEVEEVDEARSKEGYQTWPGQKKKSFFSNKAMDDETRKWKERKDAERAEREKASMKKEEVEQVDEARSKMRDYDSLEDRMKDAPKPGQGPKYNPVTRRPYKPGEPESAHTYATHKDVMQSLKRIKQHRKTHPLPEEVEEIDEVLDSTMKKIGYAIKGRIDAQKASKAGDAERVERRRKGKDLLVRSAERAKQRNEEFSDEEVARLEEIAKQFD